MEEKHLTPKEIKEFNKLISSVWGRISYKIDNISWTHYATELFNLNKEESKQHDNFRGDGIKRGISVYEETKYFSCLWLLRFAFNIDCYKPEIKDYISTKKSIFLAYSIALNYGDKIKEIVTEEEAKKINSVDYTQLI